jgi:hypothetical protein
MDTVRKYLVRVRAFEREAHAILGLHEAAKSRVVLLEDSYNRLGGLTLKQDDLFRQALRCTESALFRAAHVMGWCGFMDYLEGRLAHDNFRRLKAARPNWRLKTVDDLREYPDYQIVEACRVVGLCTKAEMKGLLGLLNKRNECAHPSTYFPRLNDTLGYIDELLQRIETLQSKAY